MYLLSALGGSVLFYLLAPRVRSRRWARPGAIFGLFGAWFVVSRRLRLDSRAIVFLIVLNLVISFAWRSAIAWQAHVGGLITGGLLDRRLRLRAAAAAGLIQVGATVIVLAVLIIAVRHRGTANCA